MLDQWCFIINVLLLLMFSVFRVIRNCHCMSCCYLWAEHQGKFLVCEYLANRFIYLLFCSPPLLMSPQASHGPAEVETGSLGDSNSTQSDEETQERSVELEKLLKNHAEWIWYWSSRPENVPPKEFLFKHPKYSSSLSVRKTGVMKKRGIFGSEFVVLFIPSLLITHLLMLGVGIYIGRRLAASSASSL
ncbi:BCL2/adenovirus E1B 19 kDa protein-interacting protein 3-like [Leucoraja erinacea]|uniref:BCL2/adenovirus E1B 19 kDa protein-interacting protein 3-like n=1 Tax=Leucoraja erinaceus TaxID=7782 RepID=UPI002453A1C4|nr:BCL2/adenovirus E1B 19 kDa protein-interacting protein 3-like [Leucoraja erinacea]